MQSLELILAVAIAVVAAAPLFIYRTALPGTAAAPRPSTRRKRPMCRHLTYLVREAPCRYVARCEHGRLFLAWGRATLRINADALPATARFLRGAGAQATRDRYYQDGDHYALEVHQGYLQVWLAGVGFYLSRADIERMLTMVEAAVEALAEPAPAVAGRSSARPQPRPTFSLN